MVIARTFVAPEYTYGGGNVLSSNVMARPTSARFQVFEMYTKTASVETNAFVGSKIIDFTKTSTPFPKQPVGVFFDTLGIRGATTQPTGAWKSYSTTQPTVSGGSIGRVAQAQLPSNYVNTIDFLNEGVGCVLTPAVVSSTPILGGGVPLYAPNVFVNLPRVIISPMAGEGTINFTGDRQIVNQAPKDIQRFDNNQRPDQRLTPLNINAQALGSGSSSIQAQGQPQAQITVSPPQLKLKTETIQDTTEIVRPRPQKEQPPPTLIDVKFGGSETLRLQKKQKGFGAYRVQLKRKGKFSTVSPPLSRAQALDFATIQVTKTLGATAKLVATGEQPRELNIPRAFEQKGYQLRDYKLSKGQRIPTKDTYIQKAQYRLGSREERQEIRQSNMFSRSSRRFRL
jgi:hypothetical protein